MRKSGLVLILMTATIFCIGSLMVFNTTSAEVLDRSLSYSTHAAFLKQMLYAFFALCLCVGIYFLGYETLLRLSGPLLFLVTCLLILVFVPGIGMQLNGANRWIRIMGHSFQPSEFAKLIIPLYVIHTILSCKGHFGWRNFCRLGILILLPICLIFMQPDNGTVAILLVTVLLLFLILKVRWIYWFIPTCICLFGGVALALQMSHVSDRIAVYLNPQLDLKGKGHQPHQARIATGSGGILGKGMGQSLQKMDYLPEARCDYIAAIFAEEFGFVGIVLLLLLYMVLGASGFSIASACPTKEGFYLVVIVTFLICFQSFLNLGVVCGLLPSKGTNLPFFSHGGSSLMMNFMGIGMILSVANLKKYEPKKT